MPSRQLAWRGWREQSSAGGKALARRAAEGPEPCGEGQMDPKT